MRVLLTGTGRDKDYYKMFYCGGRVSCTRFNLIFSCHKTLIKGFKCLYGHLHIGWLDKVFYSRKILGSLLFETKEQKLFTSCSLHGTRYIGACT